MPDSTFESNPTPQESVQKTPEPEVKQKEALPSIQPIKEVEIEPSVAKDTLKQPPKDIFDDDLIVAPKATAKPKPKC